jgi:hypothetical protein
MASVLCSPLFQSATDLDPDGERADLSHRLPKLKFGFWLAGLLFFMEFVWGIQRELARGSPESRAAGGYAAASVFVAAVVATAFLLHCISVYHRLLSEVEGWTHPITQRRAVWFHFIPIFNIYWNYKWPREIARFVNWRTQHQRMSGMLAGTITLSGFLAAQLVDSSVGLAIILTSFAYISRCLRDAFAAAPVPAELHANSGLDAAALASDD